MRPAAASRSMRLPPAATPIQKRRACMDSDGPVRGAASALAAIGAAAVAGEVGDEADTGLPSLSNAAAAVAGTLEEERSAGTAVRLAIAPLPPAPSVRA